jgi:small conductance mechanosensitive channel
MYRAFVLVLLYCALGTGVAVGQQAAPTSPQQDRAQQPPTPAGKQAAPAAPQEKLSDAERIARLQRTIEDNEQRLNELKARVDDPQGDYAKAEAEFSTLDKDLEARKKDLQKLQSEDRTDDAAALQTELEDLQKRRNLAKDRFDLAIKERKTLQEQIVTLEQKLTQDREALNKLKSSPATQPAAVPGQAPTTTPAQPQPAQPEAGQPAPAATTPAPAATTTPPPTDTTQAAPGAAPTEPSTKPPSKEVQQAQDEVSAKEAEAKIAEKTATDIADRIEQQRSLITQEREKLKLARQKVEIEQEAQRTLNEQIQKRSSEGAPQEELQPLWAKVAEARQRVRDARAEVAKSVDQVDNYQDELDRLQADYIDALEEAEAKRKEADEAQRRLEEIRNPFSQQNLLKWAVDHGPRIVGILLGMFVLLWLVRVADKRIVKVLVGPATGPDAAERENRAKTLASVFHNTAKLVIIVGGIFMILDEMGVPIAPLLGGAAVMGLAVAFGAQNLVRDYFSGFMILLENQYDVNDVIKVGDIGGLVERITLRVTVLRGLDGTVHFIPNGQIEKVSNMTHGWSRALFEIGVAYKEDVDQVMQVLVQLGKELRGDPTFRQLILDDPEMLGVDGFGDSAVVIKFFIKTRPLQQWTVKRAMLRRIKKKFDELGIEIPFPHRTVFVHHESGEAPDPELPADSTPVE